MATEKRNNKPLVEMAPEVFATTPANRLYVFAKNCTNDHGVFVIGDKARGAFSADLVQSYLASGILEESAGG